MLSVIVPCYNEEGNISILVDKFQQVANKRPDIEIIFVNNGSTDNSAKVFEVELAKYSNAMLRVFTVEKNSGYGYGILSGLKSAKGDQLAWTHADLQTEPMDVLTALEIFEKHNNLNLLVKGKRRKRRWAEAFFTFGMEVYASLQLSTHLSDINAQPKLFSRSFFERIEANAPYDFSVDLYFLYHAKKEGVIIDFPVYFNKRMHGEAKGGGSFKTRIKLIKRTLAYIVKLRGELK